MSDTPKSSVHYTMDEVFRLAARLGGGLPSVHRAEAENRIVHATELLMRKTRDVLAWMGTTHVEEVQTIMLHLQSAYLAGMTEVFNYPFDPDPGRAVPLHGSTPAPGPGEYDRHKRFPTDHYLRPEVQKFALLMEDRLRVLEKKIGWREGNSQEQFAQTACDSAADLQELVQTRSLDVPDCAADVALCAMMALQGDQVPEPSAGLPPPPRSPVREQIRLFAEQMERAERRHHPQSDWNAGKDPEYFAQTALDAANRLQGIVRADGHMVEDVATEVATAAMHWAALTMTPEHARRSRADRATSDEVSFTTKAVRDLIDADFEAGMEDVGTRLSPEQQAANKKAMQDALAGVRAERNALVLGYFTRAEAITQDPTFPLTNASAIVYKVAKMLYRIDWPEHRGSKP